MKPLGRVLLGVPGAVLALGLGAAAYAHDFLPCLLDLRAMGAGRYEVAWKPASSGAESPGARVTPEPVFPARCTRIESPASTAEHFAIDCGPQGLEGQEVSVRGLSMGTDAVLRLTSRSGALFTAVLREDAPALKLPGETLQTPEASRFALTKTYFGAGIEHILGGYDHLLFVLGLLLFVHKSEATRTPNDRRPLRALVHTITAFTLAHSVTLALSVLGVVRLPAAPVEAVIALSLFFLALELARPAARFSRAAAPRVAFLVGLLHGFGFAGALRTLGLPEGRIPLSLLMFNLGVEAGQLAVVLFALGLFRVAQSPLARAPRWLARVPAYVIGSLAVFWCAARIAAFWTA